MQRLSSPGIQLAGSVLVRSSIYMCLFMTLLVIVIMCLVLCLVLNLLSLMLNLSDKACNMLSPPPPCVGGCTKC